MTAAGLALVLVGAQVTLVAAEEDPENPAAETLPVEETTASPFLPKREARPPGRASRRSPLRLAGEHDRDPQPPVGPVDHTNADLVERPA